MGYLMDWLESKFSRKPLPSLTEQAQKYFPDDDPWQIVAIVDQHYAGLSNERTQQELKLALIEKYAGDKEMLQGMVNSLKLDYRDALVWLQRSKSPRSPQIIRAGRIPPLFFFAIFLVPAVIGYLVFGQIGLVIGFFIGLVIFLAIKVI